MDICQLLAGTSSTQHYVSEKEACLPGMMTAFIVIAFDSFLPGPHEENRKTLRRQKDVGWLPRATTWQMH